MSESLAAINIEQLSNAVNNAVNAVALPSISPAPTSSCTTGGPSKSPIFFLISLNYVSCERNVDNVFPHAIS